MDAAASRSQQGLVRVPKVTIGEIVCVVVSE